MVKRLPFMVLCLFFSLSLPVSGAIMDVGTQTGGFTGNTRGFYFTAPTSFTITGLGLPTDASTDNFDVAVLRFSAIPPEFSSLTTTFDTLFLSRNNAGAGLLSTSIAVSSGDIIGILGSRGSDSTNSYQTGPYLSSILGNNVTLSRLLMQADLRNTDPDAIGVSAESGGSIGRVFVDISPASTVPEPSTYALACLGAIGLIGCRRLKRNQAA